MTRRVVRVTAEFFVLLDQQLPDQRGPHGEPTAAEFAAGDLMDLVEEFATSWDTLGTPIRGRTDYRVLITTTHLVPYVSVYAQLSPVDGAVELIDIDIDLGGPWPDPDWPDAD
jgi:hypothetical protein